jgi:hypothetical protein
MACRPAIRIVKAFYNETVPQTAVQYGNGGTGFQIDERLRGFPGWLCHQSTDAGFCFKGREEAFYGETQNGGHSSVAPQLHAAPMLAAHCKPPLAPSVSSRCQKTVQLISPKKNPWPDLATQRNPIARPVHVNGPVVMWCPTRR